MPELLGGLADDEQSADGVSAYSVKGVATHVLGDDQETILLRFVDKRSNLVRNVCLVQDVGAPLELPSDTLTKRPLFDRMRLSSAQPDSSAGWRLTLAATTSS